MENIEEKSPGHGGSRGGGKSGGGFNLSSASAFAQWPHNIIIVLLEKYEELYMADRNFPNFTHRMWKDIMEQISAKWLHINVFNVPSEMKN